MTPESAILLIYCPDRKGLVASVTEFLAKNNGNIVSLDQYVDAPKSVFFMRIEWDLTDFAIPKKKVGEYFDTLIGKKFAMNWRLYFSTDTPRMAIYVSKIPHCLFDILARVHTGEWRVKIPLIISNHRDLEPLAEKFAIPYHFVAKTPETKAKSEEREFALLAEHKIDFIVLARYMQILSEKYFENYPNRIINIHHSFLPAFRGAKPYHSAYNRGVKVIGATSHYITPELDEGPIIEQEVVRISHTDSVADLIRKGQDLEKIVLARAIWYHIQHRILVYDNRTVIFS